MSHYKIPETLRHFPTNFNDVRGPLKIFALSDFWARKPEQFTKDLTGSSFEYCFCCFTPPYSNPKDFYSFFNNNIQKSIKFIGHPRCVDPECFKDYELPKKKDVISLGAMSWFYPLRRAIHKKLKRNAKGLGIRYKNHSYCGGGFLHSGFVREKYAQAINSSKILISCGGKYRLAFNKIFEAMGCKTLYMGNKPHGEKELHLEDGYNYVQVTKDNFVDKIKYYLEHESERLAIVENAKKTFNEHHTIDARAKDFVKSIEKVL